MPTPYSVAPSWGFEGADGNWTTFEIAIGTPPQKFRVIPSTAVSETWVPIPQGCQGVLSGLPGCGNLRGVSDIDGSPSLGFASNSSSTFETIGLYDLSTADPLFDSDSDQGLYGTDVITVDSNVAGAVAQLDSQVVAGVATADVWLGVLGLGPETANFSVKSDTLPSMISWMRSHNLTESLSFGYTAGASYVTPEAPGSLVLGGYDQARFTPSDMSFANGGDSNQTLPLIIQSIIAENVPSGTMSLLADGKPVTVNVDSTVSQLYFPQNVCDMFEEAFGLHYDSKTEYYLVNDTTHNQLLQLNPSVTFTLSGIASTSETTNIVFPYAAFDLAVGIPWYNNDTRYFPIRVASEQTRQVLGRAFLQEAYIVVDWERNNFTIGQAIHQRTNTDLVAITSVSEDVQQTSSGLSTAVIAGIAVATCVVAVILIASGVFVLVRARRRSHWKRKEHVAAHVAEYPPDHKNASELGVEHSNLSEVAGEQVYELREGYATKHELSGIQISELHGGSIKTEMEDTSSNYAESETKKMLVHEMP